jgi:thiamine biosynthesis protein ThiC
MAAMHNVGKITTIPPREHVGFPTLQDTIEGIKATMTSVHAGDMCRLPYLMEQDRRITEQRGIRKSCNAEADAKGCNKCLELCPLRVVGYER